MTTHSPAKLRLTIAGQPDEVDPSAADVALPFALTSLGRFRLDAARGAGAAEQRVDAPRDALVCLRLEGGFEWWLGVEEAARLFGTAEVRAAPGDGALRLDPRRAFRGRGARDGAAVAIALESLELVGIDLAGTTARQAGAWVEDKVLDAAGPGLYRIDLGADRLALEKLTDATLPAGEAPVLVFIHGTGSSTQGSFGELWESADGDGANGAGRAARLQLRQRYGDRVFALEHRTLTESPIDNALALAQRLPREAEVHLVTHSRGGLVGELLCLGRRAGNALRPERLDELFAEDRTFFAAIVGAGATAANGYAQQRAQLDALLKELDARRPKIVRYVRTACPALGTTLASGRLDRWLAVLRFVGGPAVQALLAFLLAVVKERTDPRSLPGLEAMMPGAALVRLLNLPDLQADADLSVLAGDIEGDSLWGRLKLALPDAFFAGDHDLVVNTGSMYGGVRRAAAGRYFFDRGPQVNHFRYFRNRASVEHLVWGLLNPAAPTARFEPLAEDQRVEPARAQRRRAPLPADAPLAIVLPGIMGSHLTADGERVWFDFPRMANGGIEEIGIDRPGIAASNVFDAYYGDFVEFLRATHEVTEFPYDWRLSVRDNALRLAGKIESRLDEVERGKRSLHIVAHSMGGLVARAMLALRPDLWQRLKSLAEPASFRLLMLGTPNRGSHQAVRLMVGQHFLTNLLALADVRHSLHELLAIVNRYPGAAELLPWLAGERDYAAPGVWQGLQKETLGFWPLPDARALAAARQTWDLLAAAPADGRCMAYVAGGAARTAFAFKIEAGGNPFLPDKRDIVFYSTCRGDGTVTWESGRLAGVGAWYAEGVEHDRLLAHPPYFPAYLDLLQTGKTDRLSRDEPAGVRGLVEAEDLRAMPPDLPPYQPAHGDFGGFGGRYIERYGARGGHSAAAAQPPTKVTVRHGDLAYARYPVCVGHYKGDTQVSAERRLDQALDGVLSSRLRLGIYPGRIGTWEIFIAPERDTYPCGALVLGLGQVGQLSPGALSGAMARMLVDYALQIAHWYDDRFGPPDAIRRARISTLLIGTGAGGFTVRDSVTAILQAVKSAKERLAGLSRAPRVYFDAVEILEIYSDVAVQAAHALAAALESKEIAEGFAWPDRQLADGISGLERATCDEAPGWWRRMEIAYDRERECLRFAMLTESRARAGHFLSRGQIKLADDFVASMARVQRGDGELSRTLYEMLIPNALKELAPERRDTVLLVDEYTARFPWEMLDDRWSDAGPLAVAAGLLRQLKTGQQESRPAPLQTREPTAFVVGNPRLADLRNFPDLPGARSEAEAVANTLRGCGYRVDSLVDADAMAILRGLHGKGWRILHLAGHGVHDEEVADDAPAEPCPACAQQLPQPPRRRSGMVIGDGKVLAPGDIEQLRWVPELVFVNCCHLGKTAGERNTPYGLLAANLAVQFVRMGVKAVIAAGWAVDDAAAKAFAAEFYAAMARGTPFGLAVQTARRRIKERYPDCNTWGAYQCYGDPHYSLAADGEGERASPRAYRAPVELTVDLDNLAARARSNRVARSKIDELLERIPPEHKERWLADPRIAASLGLACGEVRRFADAIEYLDAAAANGMAAISVAALEQRANYRSRLALEFALAGKAAEAEAQFAQAESELTLLLGLGETGERRNLMGSLWKRRALAGTDRDAALAKMREHYGKAAETDAPGETRNTYAAINLELTCLCEAWRTPRPARKLQKIAGNCERIAIEARLANCACPDLWAALDEPNALLVAALARNDLASRKDEIVKRYGHALGRGASQAQFASLDDQLFFIERMLPDDKKYRSTRQSIAEIRRAACGAPHDGKE